MNKLIIATTHGDNLETHVGFADLPSGIADPPSDSVTLAHASRCFIDPLDENKLFVAGYTVDSFGPTGYLLRYSADGGTTWGSATGLGGLSTYDPTDVYTNVRQLKSTGNGNVWLTTRFAFMKSTDDGATFTAVSIIGIGERFVDNFWNGTTQSLLLTSHYNGTPPFAGTLLRTDDTWSTHSTTKLEVLPGWLTNEAPRRIWPSSDGSYVLLLTSHRLWKLNWNGAQYVGTPVILWDFSTELSTTYAALFGSLANGYDGAGNDRYSLFDDVFHDEVTGSIWLAGNNSLRAHSIDGTTFYLDDIASIQSPTTTKVDVFNKHWFRTPTIGMKISSAPQTTLFNVRGGLWPTTNAGVSLIGPGIMPNTDGKFYMQHIWGVYTRGALGCTDPTACNYDNAATLDDGSCLGAVQLKDCNDGSIINCNTPEILALGCRGARAMIDINILEPLSSSQSLGLYVDGNLIFQYNAAISPGGQAGDRLEEFISGLIAYLNINMPGTFHVTRVPPSQNTLAFGSLGGIWFEVLGGGGVGAALFLTSTNLLGLQQEPAFDSGAAGRVIKVAELPGRCFTVCGPGNCATAQHLTLVGDYVDCLRCLPITPTTICRDCDEMLSIGGQHLFSSPTNLNLQCASAGEVLDFDILVGFSDTTSVQLTPLETGTTCTSPTPLSLNFLGNALLNFPIGSQFQMTSSSSVYTVATVFYDQNADLTTVTTTEVCQDYLPIEDVMALYQCAAQVHVSIKNQDDIVVFDNVYPVVDFYLSAQFSYQIPTYGTYEVVVDAFDCTGHRICRYWINACDQFSLVPTDCHTWQLNLRRPNNPPLSDTDFVITVTNLLDNTVVEDVTVKDTRFPFAFTVPKDGVYYISVKASDGTTYSKEVIDTCTAKACRKKMTLEIFCGGDDPCDASCEHVQARKLYRDELTRVNVLFAELEAEVYLYRTRWLGLPLYDAERLRDLRYVAAVIDALQKVALRCGLCTSVTNKIDGSCPTC